MKKLKLGLFICIFLTSVHIANAEKITWVNPATYSDGTPISTSDKSNIITTIYHKAQSETTWNVLTTVKYGIATWTGALPVVYVPGSLLDLGFTSTLYSLESAKAIVPYTMPAIPPSMPTDIVIIR